MSGNIFPMSGNFICMKPYDACLKMHLEDSAEPPAFFSHMPLEKVMHASSELMTGAWVYWLDARLLAGMHETNGPVHDFGPGCAFSGLGCTILGRRCAIPGPGMHESNSQVRDSIGWMHDSWPEVRDFGLRCAIRRPGCAILA